MESSLAEEKSTPFPVEFCKIFAIQEMLNGSLELSSIFFSYLSPEESLNIIQSLFISDPPNAFRISKSIPTTQHYRWMLSCFMSLFISQIPNRKKFVLPSYYFNIPKMIQLSMYSSKTTNSITKLLSNPIIRTSNDHQIKLAEHLLKLYNETRPLFEWMIEYRDVSKYIRSIPISTLFSQFNYNFFQLFRPDINNTDKNSNPSLFDETELNGIRLNFKEKNEIESFFSIPSVLFDGKPITSFQNTFFQDHPFPYQYSFYEVDDETNKETFSLLHTTISLKKFFVDIVKEKISKSLAKNNEELLQLQDPSNIKNVKNDEYNDVIKNNKNRLNETVNYSSILNEMQSWTFLSLFPDILNSYDQIYEQIESLSFVADNIATKLFERLKNDRVLFNQIHEWTGKFVTTNDFASNSLPHEILDFIKNLDSKTIYESIEKKSLLCLSDSQKVEDSDFLYAYLAISNEIRAISTPQDFEQIEPIAEEIGFCIERISSNEKKNSIITDLFSLLFLTEKGQFLFHTLSMQTISQILLNNSGDKMLPYINNGLIQIQLFERSSKGKNSPSSDLFISSKNKLLFALVNSNTVFAENLAKISPENQELFNSYKTVKNFAKKIQSNDQNELNSNIEVDEESQSSSSLFEKRPLNEVEEVALSIEGQGQLFDRINKETNVKEIKELTSKFDYKKPFRVIKTFSKKKFAFLKEKLENKNETKWKTPSFFISSKEEKMESNDQQIIFNDPTKLNKIKLMKGFFDYLDLLIPTLLSPGQTIETVLNKNVDEILDEFLTKEEFEKAEKLSETMKVDIRKKVLSSLKYQPICYEHYSDNLKPVLSVLSLLGNWKDYFLKMNKEEELENQKIILKLLTDENDDNKSNNLRKFILKEKDFVQPTSENINDLIEFNDNFYQEGFNVTEKVLSDALENNNNDLFIELCFRSTTQQVEAVFNDHLNNDTIENLYELMKICPVSFEFRMKYQLLYDLHHKFSCKISNINQSFIDLLSDKKFSVAAKFYKCFPEYKDDFDEIVRENLKNNIENEDVGIIMAAPHMRNEILGFFKQLKIEEEEQMFQNLIPSNWICMDDFEDTVDTNIYNDPDGAVKLLQDLKLLDCDQIILEYLNQVVIQNDDFSLIEKINFFRNECKRFISVIRNLDLLTNYISSNLLNLLLEIRIDSRDDEISLNLNLKKMMNFLNLKMFSHSKIDKKIYSIFLFCSEFFYSKFKFAYNLNEVEKNVHFSADMGAYLTAKELAESFDVEITEKSFEIYLKQFRLFFFNTKAVLPFSLKANKLQEKERIELQRKCSLKFAYHATKRNEFNGNLLRKIESSIEKEQIKSLLANRSISYINKIDDDEEIDFSLNDEKSEVFDFFTNQADIESASQFYVTDIEKGFHLLENLDKTCKTAEEAEQQRKTGFVELFITSLSYSKLNIFMKIFRQFDPSHTKYSHFLRDTYDGLDSSSFPFLKFSISQIMGDYLTTAKTALTVYTVKPDLAYLDIAESSLSELTNFLTEKLNSKSSENTSQKLNTASQFLIENISIEKVPLLIENIKRTLNKISFQRQFIVFCIENRMGGFESLNLFNGSAAIESIVTLLFKKSEFQLSTEILRALSQTENRQTDEFSIEPSQPNFSIEKQNWSNPNKPIEYETSLLRAAFSLANDGFDAVIKFLVSLQRNLKDEQEFEKIVYAFIRQFESAPFNEIDWIKFIALNVVQNKEFKVKILIQIGEFDLAADIAIEKRNKLESFIPLIANLSYSKYNMNTFYKCQKALEYSG